MEPSSLPNQKHQISSAIVTSLSFLSLTCISIIITARLLWLADGDVMQSYPFMFPDSFDWITNALYYLEVYQYHLTPSFPTIRQPLFTALVAISYLVGRPNMIIVIIQLSFLGILWYTFKCARLLEIRNSLIIVLLLFLGAHHSFNLFRMYVLSDMVCIFLNTVAVYYYLRYGKNSHASDIIRASAISSIAGVTQFFGLFPALAFSGTLFLYGIFHWERKYIQCAFLNLLPPLIVQFAWMMYKYAHFGDPFATQVSHFSLLKLSFANLSFYANVWPIFFFPIICAFLALVPFLKWKLRSYSFIFHFNFVFLKIVNILFMGAIFFYQWQESRFTSFFLATVALLGYLVLDRATNHVPAYYAFLIASLTIFFAVTPTDDLMRPKLKVYFKNTFHLRETFHHNFLSELFVAEKARRFSNLDCIEVLSERELRVKDGCDYYIFNNFIRYLHYQKLAGRYGEIG